MTVVTKQLCTPKNLTYLKPTYLPTYVTVVAVGTVVTVVTKSTFFHRKTVFTRKLFVLLKNLFTHKTTQPLHIKNNATSSYTKITQTLNTKNHALTQKKIMQTFWQKNQATSKYKN